MAQKNQPQAEILSGSPQPNFTGYSKAPVIAKRAPTTADTGYGLGQIWVDKIASTSYQLVSVSAGSATWVSIGGGSTAVATLTGDTGTATPSSGNIKIAGTANQITTAASGATVTLSLPSAITVPGSLIATTTLQATQGITAGLNITSTAGNITCTAGSISTNVGTITAAGGLIATTGGVTATSGDLSLNGVASKIIIKGAAVTNFIGTATLATGTVTIANTNISVNDIILLSRQGINGSTALGLLTYVITPATNFVITSVQAATPAVTEANDTSIVKYLIVRQS